MTMHSTPPRAGRRLYDHLCGLGDEF